MALHNTVDLGVTCIGEGVLFVVKGLVDQVNQCGDHVDREELTRRDESRRHLQVVLALEILRVREPFRENHLKTIHDHEAELVLGRDAERRSDISGLLVHNIGVRAQLGVRERKNDDFDGLQIAERRFVPEHLAVDHADQRFPQLVLQ